MDDEAWGIRDFFIHLALCAKDCVACTGPAGA